MTTPILLIAFLFCAGAATFVFICNAYTPLQFGPIPFFCTAIPAFVILVVLLAHI